METTKLQESKVGWKAHIVLAAMAALGLMFGPWAMFFEWRWTKPAVFVIAVMAVTVIFMVKSATEPASLGFEWVVPEGAGTIGNVSWRLGFGAKVYGTFAGLVAVWWLAVGMNELVAFIQTLAVPPPATYAPPAAYWAERGYGDSTSATLSTILTVALASFCLGIWLAAWIAFKIQRRRLAKQEEQLRTENATAVAAEKDGRQQLVIRVEKAARLISQAVGMLLADKRSGDKAIGEARLKLEEALEFLAGQPTAEQIRREMYSRLDSVLCPAEMAIEIVDAAMKHAPQAPTAVCKLRACANFLRADRLQNGQQERLASWCDRAACAPPA